MLGIEQEVVAEWEELRRIDSEGAKQFYFMKILPVIVKSLQEKSESEYDCKLLFSILGFSPETTVLATVAMNPQELVIITGGETKHYYDLIVEFMLEHKILRPHQIKLEEVDVHDLRKIYTIIEESKAKHSKGVFVDVTGGKKIMSASAAQAAWEIDASLCYIEGDYDPLLRRPKLGSEKLEVLDNPSSEKAKRYRTDAVKAWNSRQFLRAEELFKKSLSLNENHIFEEIMIPLSRYYQAIFDFNIVKLGEEHELLKKAWDREYLKKIMLKYGINRSLDVFENDPELKDGKTRIALFLTLASEYSRQNRFDFAGLLSYRAIEASMVECLIKIASGPFNASKPDYSLLMDDVEDLRARFSKLWNDTGKGNCISRELPHKVGLVDGFILIAVSKPEVLKTVFPTIDTDPNQAMMKFNAIISSRNSSILAHGTSPLGEKQYLSINRLAQKMAALVGGDVIEKLVSSLSPPVIDESNL